MGEDAGGAAAVLTMDHRDAEWGQRNARIELRDGRIIPGRDMPQEDAGKHGCKRYDDSGTPPEKVSLLA